MAYVVEPILWELRDPVIKGLQSREFLRWGGSVRVAKGFPGAGQFVAHLREVAPTNLAELGNVTQMPQALSSLLQLTNVAAAASVLNLGVSAVGFAVVAHKLNRLQASVEQVLAKQDSLRDEMTTGFSDVQTRLVELRFLALESRELLSEAVRLVEDVRRDLFDGYVARIQTEAHSVHRRAVPDDATLEHARRTFDEARRWLQTGLERASANPEPRMVLDALVRYRAWCSAVLLEVQVLRRSGARREAATLTRDAATRSRAFAAVWAKKLLPPEEHGGVLRFAYSRFEIVPGDVRGRLFELQEGTRSPENLLARTADVARSLAERASALPPEWFARQEAIAGLLDFLEEATERLESVAEEMEHCDRARLTYDQWEALEPGAPGSSHLALVRLDDRVAA